MVVFGRLQLDDLSDIIQRQRHVSTGIAGIPPRAGLCDRFLDLFR
jgi:hypothetical protein